MKIFLKNSSDNFLQSSNNYLFKYALPEDYVKVDYLMTPSAGNAYINTGIKLSGDNYKIETKFDIPSISSMSIFGAQSNRELMVFFSGSSYCYGGSGTETNRIVSGIYSTGTSIVSANYNSGTVTINVNGESTSYSAVTNFVAMNSYPFYLFTNNNGGNLTGQMAKSCKMYYFKLSQNGEVLRYFWPVRRISDGKAGMYDVENDVFYTSAGSADFIAINDSYQEVEYIASSGAQCINTGYYWTTENTKLLADLMVTLNTSSQSLWGNEEYYSSSGRYFAGIPHGSNFTYSYYLGTGGCSGFSVTQNTRTKLFVTTTSAKKYQIYKNDSKVTDSSFSTSMLTYAGALTRTANTGKIFIFSNHNSGTGGTTSGGTQFIGGMRCYRFGLYDNNKWQRYLVPCYRKSDSVIGMYDVVNNAFYQNAGSGTFTKGSDV